MIFRTVIVIASVLSLFLFAHWRVNIWDIDRSVKALVTQHIAENYRIVAQIKQPSFIQEWSWIGKVELLSEGKYVLDESQKLYDFTDDYKYLTEVLLENNIISSKNEVSQGQLYIGLVDIDGSYCCEYRIIAKESYAFISLYE